MRDGRRELRPRAVLPRPRRSSRPQTVTGSDSVGDVVTLVAMVTISPPRPLPAPQPLCRPLPALLPQPNPQSCSRCRMAALRSDRAKVSSCSCPGRLPGRQLTGGRGGGSAGRTPPSFGSTRQRRVKVAWACMTGVICQARANGPPPRPFDATDSMRLDASAASCSRSTPTSSAAATARASASASRCFESSS